MRLTDFCNQTGRPKDYSRSRIAKEADEQIASLKVRVNRNALGVKGITEDVRRDINAALQKLNTEYRVGFDEAITRRRKDPLIMFETGVHMRAGNPVIPFIINADCDYEYQLARAEALYQRGWFTERTTEDYVAHEDAHAMLFQGCKNRAEIDAVLAEVNQHWDVLRDVSRYAHRAPYEDRGAEALAEAFVRVRNGEKVSKDVAALVEHYYGGFKR